MCGYCGDDFNVNLIKFVKIFKKSWIIFWNHEIKKKPYSKISTKHIQNILIIFLMSK
jgi:hypothetical protein